MERMTVVYASDAKLYGYLPMAIHSLLVHNPDAKVYVFADDDAVDGLDHPNVTVINSHIYDSYILPTSPQSQYFLPSATFIRLWIAETLKEDRVLWLDVDTLVDADLTDLWNADLGDNIVAGVPDRYAYRFPEISHDRYINAGVLLMDLKKWREEGLTELSKMMVNTRQLTYGDQDVINYLCDGRILYLGGEYNYSAFTLSKDVTVPLIWHFAGHPKLWEHGGRDKLPHQKLWQKYFVLKL
jgi:lipopolysaccharide biosynthesis glycosyltransferase